MSKGFVRKDDGSITGYDKYDFHNTHKNPKSIQQYAENFATSLKRPGFESSITLTPEEQNRFDNEYYDHLKQKSLF